MTLIPIELKSEVLKIIRNDVGQAYWTSNLTKSFVWENCVEFKLESVKGDSNLALDFSRNDIGCNSKRNSICFRENIIVKPELEMKTVDEDADYDCNECEL